MTRTAKEIEALAEAVVAKLVARQVEPLMLTEEQAAERLGIPRHTLAEHRRRGRIKATKVGRRWRYSTRTLAEFAG